MSDDRLLLSDILEAIDRIEDYVADGEEAFFKDTRTQDAVIRNLMVVGEATKNLSDELRAGHPDLPWRQMAGMRDKLIHDYPGVDLRVVWNVVERELPDVRRALEGIIDELGDG